MTASANRTANTDLTDFEALLQEKYEEKESLSEGRIVKGRIVKVSKDHVVIDVGYKSEGEVPIHEFADTKGDIVAKEGTYVDVFLETLENENGLIEISKKKQTE